MTGSPLRYVFRNNYPAIMSLVIEPWAEEFEIPAGSSVLLAIYYRTVGTIETSIDSNYFTIWLWGGCRVEISIDGQDAAIPIYSIAALILSTATP